MFCIYTNNLQANI